MKSALTSIVAKYVAILFLISAGWFDAATRGASNFHVLTTQSSLLSLTQLVVVWLGACALHYVTTGDPSPVMASEEEGPHDQPSPPPPPRRV